MKREEKKRLRETREQLLGEIIMKLSRMEYEELVDTYYSADLDNCDYKDVLKTDLRM